MISVFASDTVSPNAAHALAITVIIFSHPSGDSIVCQVYTAVLEAHARTVSSHTIRPTINELGQAEFDNS